MSLYATLGYRFKLPENVNPEGSVLLAGALPLQQLRTRRPKPPSGKHKRVPHAHMQRLVFDPQLYLSGLSANQAASRCAVLATYPWFGVKFVPRFYPGKETIAQWRKRVEAKIQSLWPGRPPATVAEIQVGVRACVDLQISLGCEAIVLPSPLTFDPNSAYDVELTWLDEGLAYARSVTALPVFATVALADVCLRFSDPEDNALLDLIADAVSARGAQGVYLAIEQGLEADNARQCSNEQVLTSALHLTHLFARDCRMSVTVNFLGFFGAVCAAVGAEVWATGWYKSLHRLRLADQGAPGRAYPSFWTRVAACDVNLESEFDQLVGAGLLRAIEDRTPASTRLLTAARDGVSSNDVPAWAYSQSNIAACTEHMFHSAMAADREILSLPASDRLAQVERWLVHAMAVAARIAGLLGGSSKTRVGHVHAWLDALRHYRRIHNS